MNDKPGDATEAEPQEERGPEGSRDTGSAEPFGGPADRPAGKSDEESDTSVDPKSGDGESPDLQSGGG